MRTKNSRRRLGAYLTAAWVALAAAAPAQDNVEIEAGAISYRRAGSVLEATGGVRVHWNGNRLEAERVRFERDAGLLEAAGGVRLRSPAVLLEAEACTLDVEQETGTLDGVRATILDGNWTFGGAHVEKLSGRRLRVEDAYFTTCRMEGEHAPDWSITGKRGDVEVDGYGRIEGAAFRVRGVPVLYAPYLVFPAVTRRKSGFLLPQVGVSSKRGFLYSQPYFWAIDKHQDLTATAEVESSARLGGGLEYRYRPRAQTNGVLALRYFNEAIRDDNDPQTGSPLFRPRPGEGIPENRAVFSGSHRQRSAGNLRLYADVLLVSDDLVLRETEAEPSTFVRRGMGRSRRYTASRAGVLAVRSVGRSGLASFGVRGAFYQDLIGPDRFTLQEPGRLWLRSDGELPYGLVWLVDGELAQFHRTRSADGQRIDVNARLERGLLPPTLPLRATLWTSGRLTGYHNDSRSLVDVAPEQPPDDAGVGEPIDRLRAFAGRALFEAGLDWRSAFARTFRWRASGTPLEDGAGGNTPAGADTGGLGDAGTAAGSNEPGIWGGPGLRERFSALQHTIEPFGELRFTSDADHDELPLYDAVDRIDGRTTLTYGLASRFLFTEAASGRTTQLARVSLAQTYNVDDPVIDDHFSDIDATLGIRPTRNVSFSGLASYNVGASSLRGAAAILSLERFALPYTNVSRSYIDAGYRFVRKGAVETAAEGLESLELRSLFALSERFALGFNGRYDFVGSELVESGGGVRIESDCRCWAIDLGVTSQVNPDETQFRIALELGGVGGLGSSPLRYRTSALSAFDYGVARARRYGW